MKKQKFNPNLCFRYVCISWSNEKCPQYDLCWGKRKKKVKQNEKKN